MGILTPIEEQAIKTVGDAFIQQLPQLLEAEAARIPGVGAFVASALLPLVLPPLMPALQAWFDAYIAKA